MRRRRKQMDPKNNEEVVQIRYCKKCGCELASTNKYKLCENCRRMRNANIRKWGFSAGAALYTLLMFVPKILNTLNDNPSTDVDSDGINENNPDNDGSNTL